MWQRKKRKQVDKNLLIWWPCRAEQSADKSQAPNDALSNTRTVQRSEQPNDRTGGKEQKSGARGYWGQPIQRSLLPKDFKEDTSHEMGAPAAVLSRTYPVRMRQA